MTFPFVICAAPMAGISNRAFREIVCEYGADLAYGEMISARALGYGNQKTYELMDMEGEPSPRLVQISGCEPNFVAQAAMEAAELGAEYLDLNMGCPVPKVVKNHEGSALMQKPELAAELVKAARTAGLPVSCKIRAGWDAENRNAVGFARRMEDAGVAWIAVHGRTRQQLYTGRADRTIIAQVKQAVSVPVIANGDVYTAEDALSLLQETGCDGVMVGRGMLGNPWLFADIRAALSGQLPKGRPDDAEIIEVAQRHLYRHVERCIYWLQKREGVSDETKRLGEELGVKAMRAQLGWYTKGLRNSAQLRNTLHQATELAEIDGIFTTYLETLEQEKDLIRQ